MFTWWPPWRNMRQRNIGWRIDYILASRRVAARVADCAVLADVGTSDHAPVMMTLGLRSNPRSGCARFAQMADSYVFLEALPDSRGHGRGRHCFSQPARAHRCGMVRAPEPGRRQTWTCTTRSSPKEVTRSSRRTTTHTGATSSASARM
jgi:hypothetical protein